MPQRENPAGGTERQRAELRRAGGRLRADGEIQHPAQGVAQLSPSSLQEDVCPSEGHQVLLSPRGALGRAGGHSLTQNCLPNVWIAFSDSDHSCLLRFGGLS